MRARPSRARAAYLLSPGSYADKRTVKVDQYEELVAECLAVAQEKQTLVDVAKFLGRTAAGFLVELLGPAKPPF